jgi:hypothetical protein
MRSVSRKTFDRYLMFVKYSDLQLFLTWRETTTLPESFNSHEREYSIETD